VEVEACSRRGGVEIVATVRTVDRTGVEMEALAAVAAACLTVYDMLKRYERGMRIEAVELLEKAGGRSGRWVRPRTRARASRSSRAQREPQARAKSRDRLTAAPHGGAGPRRRGGAAGPRPAAPRRSRRTPGAPRRR